MSTPSRLERADTPGLIQVVRTWSKKQFPGLQGHRGSLSATSMFQGGVLDGPRAPSLSRVRLIFGPHQEGSCGCSVREGTAGSGCFVNLHVHRCVPDDVPSHTATRAAELSGPSERELGGHVKH